jgi:hypothetical protein
MSFFLAAGVAQAIEHLAIKCEALSSNSRTTKKSFFRNGEQENKTGPVWGLVQLEGKDTRKGCRRMISRSILYSFMKMEKRDLLKLFRNGGRRD